MHVKNQWTGEKQHACEISDDGNKEEIEDDNTEDGSFSIYLFLSVVSTRHVSVSKRIISNFSYFRLLWSDNQTTAAKERQQEWSEKKRKPQNKDKSSDVGGKRLSVSLIIT